MPLRLTPLAEADIEAIALHIAADNPPAAERWLETVLTRCRQLADHPRAGAPRFDIRPQMRTSAIGNYMILYREMDGGAQIVRVVHGARQWEKLL